MVSDLNQPAIAFRLAVSQHNKSLQKDLMAIRKKQSEHFLLTSELSTVIDVAGKSHHKSANMASIRFLLNWSISGTIFYTWLDSFLNILLLITPSIMSI